MACHQAVGDLSGAVGEQDHVLQPTPTRGHRSQLRVAHQAPGPQLAVQLRLHRPPVRLVDRQVDL
jgi:hypothetical protein